jgi:hypothetical protein
MENPELRTKLAIIESKLNGVIFKLDRFDEKIEKLNLAVAVFQGRMQGKNSTIKFLLEILGVLGAVGMGNYILKIAGWI